MTDFPPSPRRSAGRRRIKRLLTPPLVVVAVLVVLFEEYLWRWLVQFGVWLGRLPAMRRLERLIAGLSPNAALVTLLSPVTLAVPIKLLAVWLLASGHAMLGLGMLLTVKVVGTAVVARIYMLCEPALSTVAWFVELRRRIIAAKDWAHSKLEETAAWRMARRKLTELRRVRRGLLVGRWRGIRRWLAFRRA